MRETARRKMGRRRGKFVRICRSRGEGIAGIFLVAGDLTEVEEVFSHS